MRNNHLIAVDGHADLHSEHGPNRGEHSGRSIDPTINVTDLAWLDSKSPTLIALKLSRAPSGFAVGARASPRPCICVDHCRALSRPGACSDIVLEWCQRQLNNHLNSAWKSQ